MPAPGVESGPRTKGVVMSYYIDLSKLTLGYVLRRIEKDDLIPSFIPLRQELEKNFELLERSAVRTAAALLEELKTKDSVERLARKTSIDIVYLTLLSRYIRGWHPKPHPLCEAPLIDEDLIADLAAKGLKTTKDLFEACESAAGRKALESQFKAKSSHLTQLLALCDLCRIQWVNLVFARILFDSGFSDVDAVASTTAGEIYERVSATNESEHLYKGKVGLRDMGRLVELAKALAG